MEFVPPYTATVVAKLEALGVFPLACSHDASRAVNGQRGACVASHPLASR